MILSTTFDEQILKSFSIEQWMMYCERLGLKALEFSPDPSVLAFKTFKNLINKQAELGIRSTFHVPYFSKYYDSSASRYDLAYYKEDKSLFEKKYATLLDYILLSEQETLLTLHGAKRLSSKGELAHAVSRDQTWSAIDYLLGKIEQRKIPLTLCLELSGPESATYLTSREEIVESIEKFSGSPTKVCWDLTHDFGDDPNKSIPPESFVNAVAHVHIHGIDTLGQKHQSLSSSVLDFEPMLKFLQNNNYSNKIVLEVLMKSFITPDDYLNTIRVDLDLLERLTHK